MALNFGKNTQLQPNISEVELLTKRYNNYRRNLLWLVCFTVVNIGLVLLNADIYMLFSVSVPYYSVFLALLFADKLPVEYYTDFETGDVYYFEIPGAEILVAIGITVAVITLALYILMWVLSKKSYIPLIVAAVMFAFDTLGLVFVALLFGASSFVTDLIFHVGILVLLGVAVYVGIKKKKAERAERERALEIHEPEKEIAEANEKTEGEERESLEKEEQEEKN